jgi:hypothetical protein
MAHDPGNSHPTSRVAERLDLSPAQLLSHPERQLPECRFRFRAE